MNIDKSSMSFKEKLRIARSRLNSENQSSSQSNIDEKNTSNQVSEEQIFNVKNKSVGDNNTEKMPKNAENQTSLKFTQNILEQSSSGNHSSNHKNQFNNDKKESINRFDVKALPPQMKTSDISVAKGSINDSTNQSCLSHQQNRQLLNDSNHKILNQKNQNQTNIIGKSEMSFKEKLQLASNRLSQQNQNMTQINAKPSKSLNQPNIISKKDITQFTKSGLKDEENDDTQLDANEENEDINSKKIKINHLIQNTQELLDALLQKSEKIDFNAFLQQKIDEILPFIQIDFQNEEKVINKNNEIRNEILESTTIFEKKYCIVLKESYKSFLKTIVFDAIKRICANLPNNLISKIYIAKVQSMEKEIVAMTSFIDDVYVEKVGKGKNESNMNLMNEKEINANSLIYVMSENESYREIKIQITCKNNIQEHIPQDF